MSTVAHLIKQIRSLPYNDMMMVAEEIRDQIKDLTQQKIEAVVLAGILSRLSQGETPIEEMTKEEEKILTEIFRRKTQLLITRHGNGWKIDLPAVAGGQVVGKELRALFPMVLDQIITLHCLQK